MAVSDASIFRPTGFLSALRRTRDIQDERARKNPFLIRALENEKHQGQRIATIARTISLGVISLLVPFINPTIGVLYYEALLVVFVLIGWAQLRFSSVGRSRIELTLIFADLALLTFVCLVPSPFAPEQIPSAAIYQLDNFIYFFVLLAVGTLAYSWRTIIAIGTWTAMLWLLGTLCIYLFGHQMPELSQAAAQAFSGHPFLSGLMDPNNINFPARVQEVVVFLIVVGILSLKSRRSSDLLITQADLAAERANLSRYFSPNMVDTLASSDHDIGAVRTQEIAVLFSDIVGFTETAEHNSPEKVMKLLRRYHSVLENAIFQNGGTLDKYLGDGAMATFGTPHTGSDDAANAMRAARQIIADMDQASREGAKEGDLEFKVSVGVHFGPVILGDIGPIRRLEFAVVGDTVNVASRLEAMTRELDCRIVCSDELVRRLGHDAATDGFESCPAVMLRGRTAPIDVWVSSDADVTSK